MLALPPFEFREDAVHRRWHNVPPVLPARSATRKSWHVQLPFAGNWKTFELRALVVVAWKDRLDALDPKTGRLAWTTAPGSFVWPEGAAKEPTDVVETGGRVLVLARGEKTGTGKYDPWAGVAEFDVANGKPLLKKSFGGYADAMIQTLGDAALIAVGDHLETFRIASGAAIQNPISDGGWNPPGFRKAFPALAGTPLCFGTTAFYEGVRVDFPYPSGTLRAVGAGYTSEVEIEDFALDYGEFAGLRGIRWLRFANPLSGRPDDAWSGAYYNRQANFERFREKDGPLQTYAQDVLGVDALGVWTRYYPKGKPVRTDLARIPFAGGAPFELRDSTPGDNLAVTATGYLTVDSKTIRIRDRAGRTISRTPISKWLPPGGVSAYWSHPTRHGLVFAYGQYEVKDGGNLDVVLVPY